jgi:hypothetical protein
MVHGLETFIPPSAVVSPDLSDEIIAMVESDGPIGTLPPSVEPFEMDEEQQAIFLDKVGERLAFERSGVRLYEGLIAKFDAYGSWAGGPDREELEIIRGQELAHFQALTEILEMVGGDPTATTPSADIVGQIGSGICAVINDPRTNLVQCLDAILVAELADTECWDALVDLARSIGRDDIAEVLEPFADQEELHVVQVRRWIAFAQYREAPPTAH